MAITIICPNTEGHYGYYIRLIEKRFDIHNVIIHRDLTLKTILKEFGREKILLLNFWALAKNSPLIYLFILIVGKRIGQFIYNIDFLYKSNKKSFIIKTLYKALRLSGKISSFTLVEHVHNSELGLTYLPDPIERTDLTINTDKILNEFKLPDRFMLLFGSHDQRKGTYEFLKNIPVSVNIVIVGKIHDRRILEFANKEGVLIYNNFVSEEVKNVLFVKAECIVVPYQNWYGSSGVLGTAVSFEKVIIGSPDFFIGDVLDKYNRAIFWNNELKINKDEIRSEIDHLYKLESNSESIINRYFSETTFLDKLSDWNC